MPLSGLRVLVGRARHQASTLSSGLKVLGAEVIEISFIEIRKPQSYKPLDAALKKLNQYDWLVLTSVNGVEALANRMKKLRINPAAFHQLKVAAIGPATAGTPATTARSPASAAGTVAVASIAVMMMPAGLSLLGAERNAQDNQGHQGPQTSS